MCVCVCVFVCDLLFKEINMESRRIILLSCQMLGEEREERLRA